MILIIEDDFTHFVSSFHFDTDGLQNELKRIIHQS